MSSFFEGQVRDLSSQGLGVVDHPDGRVFFVKGVWPGDEGLFRIEKLNKRYGFARVEQLNTHSSERRTPPCPHLGFEEGACGGCPWMIATYPSQLEFKQKQIQVALERSGLTSSTLEIKSIIPSPQEFGYRRRAQFKTDGHTLGFVSPESHVLSDIKDCLVLTTAERQKLAHLRSRLPNPEWHPKKGTLWNYIEFDDTTPIEEIQINQSQGFSQANKDQNEEMKNWLRNKIKSLDPMKNWQELFCGDGNFTEVLVEFSQGKILVSETSQKALSNISRKKWNQVETAAGNLFNSKFLKKLQNRSEKPRYLLLDPPREGFPLLQEFVKELPTLENIFYISCHLGSFIRDVKSLTEIGFFAKRTPTY